MFAAATALSVMVIRPKVISGENIPAEGSDVDRTDIFTAPSLSDLGLGFFAGVVASSGFFTLLGSFGIFLGLFFSKCNFGPKSSPNFKKLFS